MTKNKYPGRPTDGEPKIRCEIRLSKENYDYTKDGQRAALVNKLIDEYRARVVQKSEDKLKEMRDIFGSMTSEEIRSFLIAQQIFP